MYTAGYTSGVVGWYISLRTVGREAYLSGLLVTLRRHASLPVCDDTMLHIGLILKERGITLRRLLLSLCVECAQR